MNYLLNLDYRIFEFFNAWAGKSGIGDKIIVFIGHDLPYVVAAGLLVLWLIKRKNASYQDLRIEPSSRHFARILGDVLEVRRTKPQQNNEEIGQSRFWDSGSAGSKKRQCVSPDYIINAFASALVARFVIVELIRAIIYRPRPFLSHGVVQLINKGSEPSFPSGHAAFLFAIALAIYFYDRRLGLALFIIAVFISVARIVAGVHYPADILGGAILGIVVAWGIKNLLAGKLEKIS